MLDKLLGFYPITHTHHSYYIHTLFSLMKINKRFIVANMVSEH